MFIDIHVHTRRLPGPPRIKGDKMTLDWFGEEWAFKKVKK